MNQRERGSNCDIGDDRGLKIDTDVFVLYPTPVEGFKDKGECGYVFRLIFENGDFGCCVEKALWGSR